MEVCIDGQYDERIVSSQIQVNIEYVMYFLLIIILKTLIQIVYEYKCFPFHAQYYIWIASTSYHKIEIRMIIKLKVIKGDNYLIYIIT